MQGITLTINADTASATANLTKFFADVGGQLERLPKAADGAAHSLRQIRETSMVAKEGFHGLESAVLLLGGTRFPALTEGVMSARMALLTLRSTSMLTGISLSALAPVLGAAVAIAGAGALIWKDYSDQTARAEENTRKVAASLRELPRVIGDIKTLVATKLVSPAAGSSWLEAIGAFPPGSFKAASGLGAFEGMAGPAFPRTNAQMTGRMRMPGYVQPDEMHALQDRLAKEGYLIKSGDEKNPQYSLNPQIEALQKLQELQKKVHEDGVSGFEKERVKAKATYDEMIDEADKLGALAGHFFGGGALDGLKKSISATYNTQLGDISFKQQQEAEKRAEEASAKQREAFARQAKEEREKLERELTLAEVQENEKRGHNYEQDFQKRMRLAQEQLYSGIIDEKEYTAAVEEATIARLEARRREAQEAIRLSQLQLANEKERLAIAEREIQSDPLKTELEKTKELLPVLQQKYDLIKKTELPDVEHQLANPNLSAVQRAELTRLQTGLQGEASGLQGRIGQAQGMGTFSGEFGRVITDLGNQWGSWAQQAANTFKTVFNSAVSSISSGITGLIMGTQTWGQALRQIGTSIVTQIVQSFVTMMVQWVLMHTLMAAVSTIFGVEEVARKGATSVTIVAMHTAQETTCTIVTEAGTTARKSAIAGESLSYVVKAAVQAMSAMSQIPYVGPILGIAAFAAVMAIGLAALALGMESGGYTGDGPRGEVAGVVHRGEYVFSAPAVQRIGIGSLEALHQGSPGRSIGGSLGGAFTGAGASHVNVSPAPVHVAIVNDQSELKQFLQSSAGEQIVVKHVQKNRVSMGIST